MMHGIDGSIAGMFLLGFFLGLLCGSGVIEGFMVGVAAERERCAKIAHKAATILLGKMEEVHPMQQSTLICTAKLCATIADKIRSGK